MNIDIDKCTGCGECVEACPFDAIAYNAVIEAYEIDMNACVGCMSCIPVCKSRAIQCEEATNGDD